MPPAPPHPVNVTVHVYRGPLFNDGKTTRHASLFVHRANEVIGTLIHASNSDGPWNVQMRVGYDPRTTLNLVGRMPVCSLPLNPDGILGILQQVPIGSGLEWNCQHWVGDALQAMVLRQFITPQQRSHVLGQMIDVLLQGPDDAI